MTRRKSTAYHEAGHAVIGRVLGLPCGQASIVEDHEDLTAGHSITGDPWQVIGAWEERGKFRDIASVFRGRVITFMAGAEAEKEFGFVPQGDYDDRYQIACMLDSEIFLPTWSNEKRDRYEERLRAKTRSLVCRHRGSIGRVAQALREHETLQDDQIYELINRAADD